MKYVGDSETGKDCGDGAGTEVAELLGNGAELDGGDEGEWGGGDGV